MNNTPKLDRSSFSSYFNISKSALAEYGALDISLLFDMPLFIDPMLIFSSDKPEYNKLHESIIRYFHFLATATVDMQFQNCRQWFLFPEIPNNWLGFSVHGNKGHAFGEDFASFLHKNIAFIFSTENITKGFHFEKVTLLNKGDGRDKISDLTLNLILDFICTYTENFAISYIDESQRKDFRVDKAIFDYNTKSFVPKTYNLPFIYDENGIPEYVLLTPTDLLRADDVAVNKRDMLKNFNNIVASIDNAALRAYVNNYISEEVHEFEAQRLKDHKTVNESSRDKVKLQAFEQLLEKFPVLYDYYIKLKEENPESANSDSSFILSFMDKTEEIIRDFPEYEASNSTIAKNEAISRVKYLKHCIEDCDGYKLLYDENGKPVGDEKTLQRIFHFVWYKSICKISAETNNGRGPADFVVSIGAEDQCVIEFKLASNSKLSKVFDQSEVYKKAHGAKHCIQVIFYFDEKELNKIDRLLLESGKNNERDRTIFIIDCMKKLSASKI